MKSQRTKRVVALVVWALCCSAAIRYATALDSGQLEKSRSAKPESGRSESIVIEPRPTPPRPVPPRPGEIGFDVDIWTDQDTYNIGDLIRINFRVTRPCFVYIFDTDTRGQTHQLFPNHFDRDNYVVPGRRYFIPDSSYRLRVTGPPGREELRIVAARYRAVRYEDRHRFSSQDPFPAFQEGAKGFLREYQSENKKSAPDAASSEMRNRAAKAETSRGRAEVTFQKQGAEATRSESARKEGAGGRAAESIIIEPTTPPRQIVVEPNPIYDRDIAEDSTAIGVVDAAWQPAPMYGQMSVSSTPPGARVVVDRVLRGYTPVTVPELAPGFHSLEVSLRGYHTFAQDIEVREGQTSIVRIRLEQEPRSRWFFDFGLGF